MDTNVWLAILPLAGLAANVACQLLGLRLLRRGLLRSIFAGFFVGMLFVIAAGIAPAKTLDVNFWAKLAADVLIYCALGYGYFHFVNLTQTARRIRLLRELVESPQGLTATDVYARYGAEEVLAVRLRRLLNNRQVVRRQGRMYIARPGMMIMTRIILILKKLLLGKTSPGP